MFKIARRLVFYGGIGFLAGLGVGYYAGKTSTELSKPAGTSQLEQIADKLILTNPENQNEYVVDFDRLRLKPYKPVQTPAPAPPYEEKGELRNLFE